jgi:hypothetical protein
VKEQDMSVILEGQIVSGGQPVRGAMIRLLGTEETLGADPRAAVYEPLAVAWTRTITGFAGTAWNCWQKFVARQVSGLTWDEFQVRVTQYNPSLRETGGRLEAERTYLLPEPRPLSAAPEIVCDREVSGFAGDRWACWQKYGQNKVTGMDWAVFQKEIAAHNPHLAEDNYRLVPDKVYRLPRNAGQQQYARVRFATVDGSYRFEALPPGRYELEVIADGLEPLRQTVEISNDTILDLEPIQFQIVTPRGPSFVDVQGNQFVLNGRPFRFIGVNLRGLAHYGTGKYPSASQRDQLKAANEMGARVVRLFLPYKVVPTPQVTERLTNLVNLVRSEFPNLYLIMALTDLYIDSEHYPLGDEGFYKTHRDSDGREWTLLGREWFDGGYRKNYQPFVDEIVPAFHDEPHILAWEIGNELQLPEARSLFIDFHLKMAEHIRDLDRNHLISTGMMSTHHAALQFPGQRRLYGSPNIQFVTSHIYNADYRDDDSELAAELKKPFLVEEAGFDACPGDDRGERLRRDMETLFQRGARGYMQWGFMAGSDNNDGDKNRGMGHVPHTDWNSLFGIYRQRANNLLKEPR